MKYGGMCLESVRDNTKTLGYPISGRESKPVFLEHKEGCHATDKDVWFLSALFILVVDGSDTSS
jgi:hypothetical protein